MEQKTYIFWPLLSESIQKAGEDMHCPNCGAKVSEGDRYCGSCKHDLITRSVRNKRPNRWWLLPILAFVVAFGGLTGYYFYEQSITESALNAFHQGEKLALKGNYDKAQNQFKQSLNAREHFAAAQLNKKMAGLALDIQSDLNTAEKERKDGKFQQSLNQIDKTQSKLESYKGPVVEHLTKAISDVRVTTMVAQLRHDMKGKSTIEELAPILTRAKSLETPKAKKIAKQVCSHIVKLAYSKASDNLKENQFDDALTAVKAGLLYDEDNNKLLNLKKSIKEQQNAFAKAEQQRIQQAMASAKKEQSQNRHNALKLAHVATKLNDHGDLTVSGTVKNIASVPISLITVAYTLYDSKGNVYATNEAYIFPNTLYPGETGSFEYTHFHADGKMKVQVNRFSWYLN